MKISLQFNTFILYLIIHSDNLKIQCVGSLQYISLIKKEEF
jgi:hypothetical protein